MRRLILLLLVSLCVAQTGPHRKVFSGVIPINCTNFPTSGILEAITVGNIFWDGGVLTLNSTSTYQAGDIIEVVAENDGGNGTAVPTIVSSPAQTWNVILTNLAGDGTNRGIWYALVSGSFSGINITVNYHTTSSFSTNYSITGVHVAKGFVPSLIAPAGNTGVYPSSPTFTLNTSTVTFASAGTSGDNWYFGGVGIPSTATYLHGLVIVGVASGATYSGTPPAGWSTIKVAGFPSSGIFYSCSFP